MHVRPMVGPGAPMQDSDASHRQNLGSDGRTSSRGHFALSVTDVFSSPVTISSASASTDSVDEDMVWELAKEFQASCSESESPKPNKRRNRDEEPEAPKPPKPANRARTSGENTQAQRTSTPRKQDRRLELREEELLELARQTNVAPPRALKNVMREHGAKFKKKTAAGKAQAKAKAKEKQRERQREKHKQRQLQSEMARQMGKHHAILPNRKISMMTTNP